VVGSKVTEGLVTDIAQVLQNAQTLADAVNDRSVDSSLAMELIRAGQVFFPYRYRDQLVFIPAKFLGYSDNSVETCVSKRGVRNGGVARKAIAKILGYDAITDAELETIFLDYCDAIGVKAQKRPHSFWVSPSSKNFLKNNRSGIHDLDQSEIGNDDPEYRERMAGSYVRRAKVRRDVLMRAKGTCEYRGCSTFFSPNGEPFLETHHVILLSEQGLDTPRNVIALCPNHHREAHFGERWQSLQDEFLKILKGLSS
jgi:HNH endonuclease